jgi:hypothetical protein
VYQSLTGRNDGWASFINLVKLHYPTGRNYNPLGDNLFPVSNLSAFLAAAPITTGYAASAQIFIDNPAMAEVVIELESADHHVASVHRSVTIPVGASSASVEITAARLELPFKPKSTKVKAKYAGRTLEVDVQVVPPQLSGFTIKPTNVVLGQQAIGTLTLDNPSLRGDVEVAIASDYPLFDGIPTSIKISEKSASTQFTITPVSDDPAQTLYDQVEATSGQTTLTATLGIWPADDVGALFDLVLQRGTVSGGSSISGTVSLTQRVTTPTVVGLAAVDPSNGRPWLLTPANESRNAHVPQSVTIPAGEIGAEFSITTTPPPSPITSVVAVISANAVSRMFRTLTITS